MNLIQRMMVGACISVMILMSKKIYNMKTYSLLLIAITSIIFASCANDDISSGNGENKEPRGITASVPSIEFANTTRSTLNYDASRGMLFKWSAGDKLTIFPDGDDITSGTYTLDGSGGGANADFKGEGFTLKKDALYYAFSKTLRSTPSEITISNKRNIQLDFSGQRQVTSGTDPVNTAHLGDYDFLAAVAKCTEMDDNAHFAFKRIGFTMFVTMTNIGEGHYKRLEVYDSENTYRQPVRTINLTNGFDGENIDKYAPYLNEEDITSSRYINSSRLYLNLGPDTGGDKSNDNDEGIAVAEGGTLQMFVQLPPVNMSTKKVVFKLIPSDPAAKSYFLACDGLNFLTGKAYRFTGNAEEATSFNINVKVDYDWQHGEHITRATTGDPGNDDGCVPPNYIYAFFCVDGKVVTYKQIHVGSNDEQTDKSKDKWSDKNEENIITYLTPITFTTTEVEVQNINTAKVYIAASKTPLTISGITEGTTTEDVVKAISYDMQSVESSNTELDASQQFMRDLYSTPWENDANFVGKLTDPYQDIILYHTAAKVDLKWNSTTMLSGDVKVSDVKNTGLSLFQPTTNANTSGSYTVTSAIEADRMYNGRQVFYLPQFVNPNCTYSVKVGAKDAEDADFTPTTTKGFTSWLRWLKTY